MKRPYDILINRLPWMDRIKPMSEAKLDQLKAYAEKYPEKLKGKDIVVAVLDKDENNIAYHFTTIESVITVDDTCIDVSIGKEVDNKDSEDVVFVVQLGKLGYQVVRLWMGHEALSEGVAYLNSPNFTEPDDVYGNVYLYTILNPPSLRTRTKRKPAKKLNSFPTTEGNVSSQRPLSQAVSTRSFSMFNYINQLDHTWLFSPRKKSTSFD